MKLDKITVDGKEVEGKFDEEKNEITCYFGESKITTTLTTQNKNNFK